jgi:hypothetical protein
MTRLPITHTSSIPVSHSEKASYRVPPAYGTEPSQEEDAVPTHNFLVNRHIPTYEDILHTFFREGAFPGFR